MVIGYDIYKLEPCYICIILTRIYCVSFMLSEIITHYRMKHLLSSQDAQVQSTVISADHIRAIKLANPKAITFEKS